MGIFDMDKIFKAYKKLESIKAVSKELGISEQSVRKVLITVGIFRPERHYQIMSLYKRGFKPSEIAEKLSLSRSTVSSYLPYTKCKYNAENPSQNAIKIRKCREK